MVALLLVLFGASLYGEKIPINNGAGFDDIIQIFPALKDDQRTGT